MLRIVLLIFALAAGGAAAWVVVLVRSEPVPPVPVTTIIQETTPPVQDVLVATTALGSGATLIKENMRWQSWPESALNPAYITRSARPDALETLAGSNVNSRIYSGEPIQDENLRPLHGSPSAMRLRKGKRAVAVEISAHNFGGGLIQQYDRVDVLLTVTPTATTTTTQGATTSTTRTSNEGQIVYTRTLLRNVPVLAIDMATEPTVDERSKDENGKANGVFKSATATLELDPRQAEILATGEATGKFSLALRSEKDNEEKPPITRMQSSSSQSVSSSMVGTMKIYHITTSNTSVEITEPAMPLGPAWAPSQETIPPEQHQVQRGGSGFAVVRQGDTGAAIR
jgi:pilus assembly protein CpaB